MTTIFTIIDRFSKVCHLTPLRKLPTTFQTVQLLVKHVFRLHGIPQEILSDRGPQFTSQVWKHFCSALDAQVTLTSGYHPQSNGQTERMNQEFRSEVAAFERASLLCFTFFSLHITNYSEENILTPYDRGTQYVDRN